MKHRQNVMSAQKKMSCFNKIGCEQLKSCLRTINIFVIPIFQILLHQTEKKFMLRAIRVLSAGGRILVINCPAGQC